jgi:hypothetical protein
MPATPVTPEQAPLTPAPGLPSADSRTPAPGAAAQPDDGALPPLSSLAASQSGVSGGPGIPGMIADAFGGAGGTQSILTDITVAPFRLQATGSLTSGNPFQPGSPMQVVFDVPGGVSPIDLISEGVGSDVDGDNVVDVVSVAEPVPPTDAPTAPGPGFTYDGGTARNLTQVWDGPDTYDVQYSYSHRQRYTLILPSPGGPGGGVVVGRLKIAENNSPLPRHRIFLNYSLFDNVPLAQGGVTVNRFSPGFETTFLDDQASFELRAPFATTLGSTVLVDGPLNMGHVKWGDVFMALKFLLYETPQSAISGGLAMTLPVADDLHVRTRGGKPLVTIENEAIHLMPFIGWLHQSPNGFFTQGFAQFDFDSNGNSVAVNVDGQGLAAVGRVQDTTYLQADWGLGYLHWVTPGRFGPLIRVVPTVELHYTRSLESADFVETRDFRIGQAKGDVQLLNFVVGSTFDFNNNSALTVGYVAPIGNGRDQLFDGELRAFWNRFF